MTRTVISEAPACVDTSVKLSGWVNALRLHKNVAFIELRDRSGRLQVVIESSNEAAFATVQELHNEDVVTITGLVKARPGKEDALNTPDDIEVACEALTPIAQITEDLPIDMSKKQLDVNLDTLLDHRHLTLRNPHIGQIFAVYDTVLASYAAALRADGFREIKSPKMVAQPTEGGAEVFKVKYFDTNAYLAQSPQFYKQAGVGSFERVFEIGTVFRAEPHYTTRHVSEYVSIDAEMGFIDSFADVMDQLERVMRAIMTTVSQKNADTLVAYEEEARVPEAAFPRMTLAEAHEILATEFDKTMDNAKDIDPEGERLICQYVKEKFDSDFVFLTHYPAHVRPFYIMPSADTKVTESFDLLYRGVEIATGGQRIHDYGQLVESIKSHGMEPEDFASYLAMFKNAMPPHGGWGMGSERIVQKLLGLENIREAILYPRDVKRLEP